jgi:hypothetical protein
MPRKLAKSVCALTAVLLTLAPVTSRAGFEDGLSAARDGAFETALLELRPLAMDGHVEAQYILGQMYYFGRGLPQRFDQAVEWFTRAAKQGSAAAQHDLGVMYLQGQGVPKNLVQSYRWFDRAAKQSYADADRRKEQVAKRLTPSQLAAAQGLGKGDRRASFRTGAEILDLDKSQQGLFIQGMADLLWETQLTLPERRRFAWVATCLRHSTAGELVDMYTNYLRERPAEQKYAAAETFIVMMKNSCTGSAG